MEDLRPRRQPEGGSATIKLGLCSASTAAVKTTLRVLKFAAIAALDPATEKTNSLEHFAPKPPKVSQREAESLAPRDRKSARNTASMTSAQCWTHALRADGTPGDTCSTRSRAEISTPRILRGRSSAQEGCSCRPDPAAARPYLGKPTNRASRVRRRLPVSAPRCYPGAS